MVQMEPVRSSNIAAIGYHSGTQTLTVQFHSGGVFEYADVTPETMREFRAASSVGSYFAAHIRPHYTSRKVTFEGGE